MTSLQSIKQIIVLGLALFVLAGYAYTNAQWAGPTGAPPSNNVSAPINVGDIDQIKLGDITVVNSKAALQMWSPEYCDENGQNCTQAANLGGGGGSSSCTIESVTPSSCVYPSGDMTNAVSCPSGYTPTGPSFEGSSCSTNNYTYTRTCVRTVCSGGGGGSTLPTCGDEEIIVFDTAASGWVCSSQPTASVRINGSVHHGGSVTIGDTVANQDITVNGSVRARNYCDETGGNCTPASALSGGGGGSGTWGTWTNVTGSRSGQTWYRNNNSTGLAVHYQTSYGAQFVYVSPTGTNADRVTVSAPDGDSGEWGPGFFIVPPGHYYYLNNTTAFRHFSELVLPF